MRLVAHAARGGLEPMEAIRRGYTSHLYWRDQGAQKESSDDANPLRVFFDSRTHGKGIWKWEHYFDIYDRHFKRFRGRDVHVLEIGIYAGGSLELWKDYFGARCHIYGVDIEPACKEFEDDSVKVFIGDQADRSFWQRFRRAVPTLDIVIDDGGHLPEQQIVTLEELLPHLQPGGVYLCEDVHGAFNWFASYLHGFTHRLNAFEQVNDHDYDERRIVCKTTEFQSAVQAIHLYPFAAVIERTPAPILELLAPKHGTQWQPFPK
jgi:hypothetical protein